MLLIHFEAPQPGSRLTLWQINKSEEELIEMIHSRGRADLIPPPHFKSNKRRMEWLATRSAYLLANDNNTADILYNPQGKPYPASGKGQLSLSHAGNCICLLEHETLPVGVDIERITNRIINIAGKFINAEEQSWLSSPYNLQELYLVWASKEAVFKMKGVEGLDFRKNLTLMETKVKKAGISVLKYTQGDVIEYLNIYYRFLDSMILVYTIANDT